MLEPQNCDLKMIPDTKNVCINTCQRVRNKQPKPTVYEKCISGCSKSMDGGCMEAKQELDRIVEKRKTIILKQKRGEKLEEAIEEL